jgi:hypothetical protein
MRRWWKHDRWQKVSAAVVDGWQQGLATGEAAMSELRYTSSLPFDDLTVNALQATMVAAIAKHGWDRTPLNPEQDDYADNLPILVEEIGEVARAMTYDNGNPDDLVKELLQTAAMALAWVQARG